MSANPVQNPLQKSAVGSGRRVSQPPARHDFSKIKTAVRIPNLIEIQRDSYNRFLQMDLFPEEREQAGLQAVFRSVFPVSDFRETASSTSSSTTSATGSASADASKVSRTCARTASPAARSSRSTRSRPARRSATTAARSTPSARRSATTAASPSASSTSTTSRSVRSAA
jgi:DNA-directed RNA polymerase beta subunit